MMASKCWLVVLLGALAGSIALCERLSGPCPKNHRIVENIDWIMMHDRWFSIKQSNSDSNQDAARCMQTQLNFASPYLNFTHIKYLPNYSLYEKVQGHGLAGNTGRVSMFIQTATENWNDVLFEVLDTDYYNYAVVFFCRNEGPFTNYQRTYVLSRTSDLDSGYYAKIDAILKANGLNATDSFQDILQDCGRISCFGDYDNCQYA